MKNYCLISHTHWDREWYLPFENFRMRLVDLFDHLLEILENDPGYRFNMDAQTIVLEDYLAVRPEKRPILEKHIADGRILVGPWYVQNDFHLTSGEATVRNLMLGSRIADSFGGCMNVGYAADQFGLISQLPQILARFGLRECVFGRGFDRHDTEFFWESEDGSKVLCEHMRFWYNNAQRLSPDPEGALALIRGAGANCAAHCAGSNYLLMNGVDHLEAQEDLTEVIEKVRPLLNEDEAVFQDTLPDFMARVRAEIEENGVELKTFRGEFRDNGADNVLTGTLSSRIYIKKTNARTQAMLEKRLEPLYALLAAAGVKDYPADYMTYLWKLLIENHPHDSICGCSVDAVHRHMTDRYERIAENASDLFERGIDVLNAHLDCSGEDPAAYRLILLNPVQLANDTPVSAVADIPMEEDGGSLTITDEQGDPVPFLVEKRLPNTGRRILSPINLPGEKRVCRYFLRFDAGVTAGLSYRVLTVKPCEGAAEIPAVSGDPYRMENEFLAVQINENGTVDLTDKRGGLTFRDLLAVEDCADRGNSYNFMPGTKTVTSHEAKAKVEVLAENALESRRRISYRMEVEREEGFVSLGVEIELSLCRRSDELNVTVKLDNGGKQHRVRLLLPTDRKTEQNYAGQPFDCITRNKVSLYRNDATHPNTDFVGIEDEEGGLAVLNEGLYEYEQCTDDRNTLALTILRATGRITGGWEEAQTLTEGWQNPEGNCLGEQICRIALVPYAGGHVSAGIAARSQRFLSPMTVSFRAADPNKFIGGRPFVQGPGMPDLFYRPVENADAVLPKSLRVVRLESSVPNAVILSAVKRAEDGNGTVLRLYNSTSENVRFTLTVPGMTEAEEVSLNEAFLAAVAVADGTLACAAKPKEIVTFRVR